MMMRDLAEVVGYLIAERCGRNGVVNMAAVELGEWLTCIFRKGRVREIARMRYEILRY
jgi:hypothetical protein